MGKVEVPALGLLDSGCYEGCLPTWQVSLGQGVHLCQPNFCETSLARSPASARLAYEVAFLSRNVRRAAFFVTRPYSLMLTASEKASFLIEYQMKLVGLLTLGESLVAHGRAWIEGFPCSWAGIATCLYHNPFGH